MAETPNRDEVRDYLLGRLTGPARDSVAAHVLEDEDVFALARETEDDLLDALARGDLSDAEAAEARRFTEDSGQSQRLVMARALAQSGRGAIRGPVFVRSFLAIAATLMICLVGAFFYYQGERVARQQSAAEAPTREPVIFAFAVPPGVTRGAQGAVTRVKIPAATELVRIHLELDPGYENYSVSLRNGAGKELQRVKAGELEIPAQLLPRGRYEIAVTANKPGAPSEPLNFHYFEIESGPTR